MAKNYLFPPAPMQESLTQMAGRWLQWFQNVQDALSAVTRAPASAVTSAASPWTYQYIGAGRTLLILAGTITLVELSRDGVTYYQVGVGPGAYPLLQGDFLRITHAGITSATLMPQ